MIILLGDELLIKKAYIECSNYRLNVFQAIGDNGYGMPSRIAKKAGIKTNHVSKVLKELKEAELVECINEDQRKGRLYRLTRKGEKIYNDITI